MEYFIISVGTFGLLLTGMAALWYSEYRNRVDVEQWASQLWDENYSLRIEKSENERKISHLREQVLHHLAEKGWDKV